MIHYLTLVVGALLVVLFIDIVRGDSPARDRDRALDEYTRRSSYWKR